MVEDKISSNRKEVWNSRALLSDAGPSRYNFFLFLLPFRLLFLSLSTLGLVFQSILMRDVECRRSRVYQLGRSRVNQNASFLQVHLFAKKRNLADVALMAPACQKTAT